MFNLKKLIKLTSKNMQLKELVNSVKAINTLTTEKLPITVSYKISLFLNKIQPELKIWEDKRMELIKELGTPKTDEEGKEVAGEFKFDEEKGKEFSNKINELLDEEVSVEVPDIKIADLGDIKIAPETLVSLTWLIKE